MHMHSGRQGLLCIFLFLTYLKSLLCRERDYALGVFHFQMFLHRALCFPPTCQSPMVSFTRKKKVFLFKM